MPDPLGHCPNCNRPVFAGQRRCFCGFDLKALQAQWAAGRAAEAEAARRTQEAAERERAEAAAEAEAARQAEAAAERERERAGAERQRLDAEAQRKAAADAEHQRAEAEARAKAAAERQRVEAEAREKAEAEAEARRKAGAERQRVEAEAREKAAAAAAAEREHAEAERQGLEAEAQRKAEAERQRPDAEADRQRAEAEAREKAEARRQAEAEAEHQRQTIQTGTDTGNRRRILQFGGGAMAMMLLAGLGLWLMRPSPAPAPTPGGRGLPLRDAAGVQHGLLLGLARPAPGGPVPYAIVSIGPQGPGLQHPLEQLLLRPGAAVTRLTPEGLAALPAAAGAPDPGFDLAGFVAGRPAATLVQERAAQRVAMGDWATARLLLRWAVEDLPEARDALAQLYDPGLAGRFATPFPPDRARAVALYEQAAGAGDAEAARRLAALRAPTPDRTTSDRDRSPPPDRTIQDRDRPTPPDRTTPDRNPPPERDAGSAVRATLAKGVVLGVEIGRAAHRIDAMRLLVAGVEREAVKDGSLEASLAQWRASLTAAETALDQQLTAFAATLDELRPAPAATLQAAAQAVRADPAYGGPANDHALDALLTALRQPGTPARDALLHELASPP